jgi:hypothetical protein
VRRGNQQFSLEPGKPLRAGDAIRFAVVARRGFLMIASVDGRGQAQVYVPYAGSESSAVPTGRPLQLPEGGSIELDATPGPERVFALFSARPLQAGVVLAALRALGGGGPTAIRDADRLAVETDEQLSQLIDRVEK